MPICPYQRFSLQSSYSSMITVMKLCSSRKIHQVTFRQQNCLFLHFSSNIFIIYSRASGLEYRWCFWAWIKGCSVNYRIFVRVVACSQFSLITFFSFLFSQSYQLRCCCCLWEFNRIDHYILPTQLMNIFFLEMHFSSGTEEMMTASFLLRLLLFSSPSINDRYSEVLARIYDEQYATRLLSVPS